MPRRHRPELALPHLYEVIISHPRIPGFHGLNMAAVFVDDWVPVRGAVKLHWIPDGAGAPSLWVQAGGRSTPWRDGRPDLGALGLNDPRHPACTVWVEAMNRLHERYAHAVAVHREQLRVAHEKVMARLIAQAVNAYEPAPRSAGPDGAVPLT